ncbi:MAG: UDP-N-acetylglucosamine pyrophosphorylase [Lachnospiraceae bacterium]|nr:UDP-N-acetylglucosamine pyrophosphorylase [Lachnospiraceae bacterium]
MAEQLKVSELYEPGHTRAWEYLEKVEYPWEILKDIKNIILEIGPTLDKDIYEEREEGVWVAKSAKIFPTAYLGAPCIIGENTEVRQAAFIRGSALVGDNCVVGNSVELKNVIISDNVQVPHYNYVGDSVLGYKSHMGAGSITSNVKSDKTLVTVRGKETSIDTGLKKFGAMLGDFVEVGCNSVLNPGTVIGSHSNIYPTSSVRGVVPSDSIYKSGMGSEIVEKR